MFRNLVVVLVSVMLAGSLAFAADTKSKPRCEDDCYKAREVQTKKDGNTRKSDPKYDTCKEKCDKKGDQGK
ncbi:hypothetical protein [Variovorax paradoxus]|uniref:hypothetical protein n=1 Tax=Variovorax paradoxus TaxID=34073 RepID=UPI003ECD5580